MCSMLAGLKNTHILKIFRPCLRAMVHNVILAAFDGERVANDASALGPMSQHLLELEAAAEG